MPPGKHWRSRKAVESHCAAARCSYPLLARNSTLRRAARVPLQPWPGYSTLRRAARVPLLPSNCCLHLVIPPQSRNGDGPCNAEGRPAADAERDLPPQRGRAPRCSPRLQPIGILLTDATASSATALGRCMGKLCWPDVRDTRLAEKPSLSSLAKTHRN